MTLLLKQIFAFFKLLNSDKGTNQIAAGIAFGVVLGFSPFLSLQTFLVIFLLFFFRIQIGAAFLSAFFFAFPAYLLDSVCNHVGAFVLELPQFRPVFTALYNMPIVPLTRFNNTIVMGSGVFALLIAPLMFFVSKYIILQYRHHIVARFKSTKAWKLFTATTFYQWYAKYDQFYG